jgi:hypothetical protein
VYVAIVKNGSDIIESKKFIVAHYIAFSKFFFTTIDTIGHIE